MFTIRGSVAPVLFKLTGIFDRNGRVWISGVACGGTFTCEIDLDDMVAYGIE
jgi:hypothetical protein